MSRFIPNDHAGTRHDTLTLLLGTAKEFNIDVREVRTTMNRTGFNISDRLAATLDANTTKKTSGNRAAKKNTKSQKGNS